MLGMGKGAGPSRLSGGEYESAMGGGMAVPHTASGHGTAVKRKFVPVRGSMQMRSPSPLPLHIPTPSTPFTPIHPIHTAHTAAPSTIHTLLPHLTHHAAPRCTPHHTTQ
jgi:hypothetical protein